MSFLSKIGDCFSFLIMLKTLFLYNFRNQKKTTFKFSDGANLILGPNTSGKTNVLEAVYLLSSGKSFRAEKNLQMISWGEGSCRVEGEIGGKENHQLGIKLIKEGEKIKKIFLIDGVVKTRREFLSVFSAVLFLPDDTRIITGSPRRRRDFLDGILSLVDWRYFRSLSLYKRALRQRNRLLDKIREKKASLSELFYWDQALAKNGEYILEKRRDFCFFVNQFFQNQKNKFLRSLRVSYLPNPITLQRLSSRLNQDLHLGWTSIGPHKDEFRIESREFEASDQDLSFWGSRAQHRLAILGLKLAELIFLEGNLNEPPTVLLDDIFSELDTQNRQLILPLLRQYQTIVTAAELPQKLIGLFEHVLSLK